MSERLEIAQPYGIDAPPTVFTLSWMRRGHCGHVWEIASATDRTPCPTCASRKR